MDWFSKLSELIKTWTFNCDGCIEYAFIISNPIGSSFSVSFLVALILGILPVK